MAGQPQTRHAFEVLNANAQTVQAFLILGKSHSVIAEALGLGRPFVTKWLNAPAEYAWYQRLRQLRQGK